VSTDVKLDENGDPDFSNGRYIVNGVDELKQSLEMRLLSSVGWAVNDIDFGVEWLDFFSDGNNADLAEDKISEALEQDDRIQAVISITVTPNYDKRIATIQTVLQLADDNLIADNGDPNLDFDASISI